LFIYFTYSTDFELVNNFAEFIRLAIADKSETTDF